MTLTRAIAPGWTVDVRGLLQAPGSFARDHHVQLAWWSLGSLTAATLLAWAAADPRMIRGLQNLAQRRSIRWLTGASSEDITEVSAWFRAFEQLKPDGTGLTNVGVLQDNGSYIQGSLVSASAGGLDYDKRELILTAPLIYVTADGVHRPMPVQMVIIAGRNITRLDVIHLPAEPAANPPAPRAPEQQPASPAAVI